MQMVADWKLEVMCKRLMEEIWQDRNEAIQEACIILKKCYQANMDKNYYPKENCNYIKKNSTGTIDKSERYLYYIE